MYQNQTTEKQNESKSVIKPKQIHMIIGQVYLIGSRSTEAESEGRISFSCYSSLVSYEAIRMTMQSLWFGCKC